MSIGKTLRFEIFARDSFTCQYCGRRPPEVILEIDHIHPKSKEGSDDAINLLTTCFDCNRGKRDKVISEVAPRPDADLLYLRTQQEKLELERFLKISEEKKQVEDQTWERFGDLWASLLGNTYPPSRHWLNYWLKTYGADELDFAIRRMVPRFEDGRFGYQFSKSTSERAARYVTAIMKARSSQSPTEGEKTV